MKVHFSKDEKMKNRSQCCKRFRALTWKRVPVMCLGETKYRPLLLWNICLRVFTLLLPLPRLILCIILADLLNAPCAF